jgi:nuclear GTP-binding protein
MPQLPTTSSSLGAPALLHLLKQYALSTPHSSLTVGVIGYPNVGKSSLINSLKRSRACGVAAMPGKTRVVQEVVLDKGVKILDCPGVVLEDFGNQMDGEEGRRKQAEIMLRNCVKAELVEDPTAPGMASLMRFLGRVADSLQWKSSCPESSLRCCRKCTAFLHTQTSASSSSG